jgi:hypothetical protein
MSTQYRLVQSGKTASGGCSAGQGSSEPVVPRIYLLYNIYRTKYVFFSTNKLYRSCFGSTSRVLLYPYHPNVSRFYSQDATPATQEFNLFLQKVTDPFLTSMLFIHEVIRARSDMFYYYTHHAWTDENPMKLFLDTI